MMANVRDATGNVYEEVVRLEARVRELKDDLDSKQQTVQSLFELAQARSIRIAELEATGPECDLAEQALEKLEWLAREFDGCAEANSRDFDGVWAMVEIGKRGKVYYAVNGRRYPREEAAALLKGGDDEQG
jgi:hypothetical protein